MGKKVSLVEASRCLVQIDPRLHLQQYAMPTGSPHCRPERREGDEDCTPDGGKVAGGATPAQLRWGVVGIRRRVEANADGGWCMWIVGLS